MSLVKYERQKMAISAADKAILKRIGGKAGFQKASDIVVFHRPDDPTATVVVFQNSVGVSLDGETQVDNYAVLLEMGGMGGLDVTAAGIASDFLDIKALGLTEKPA